MKLFTQFMTFLVVAFTYHHQVIAIPFTDGSSGNINVFDSNAFDSDGNYRKFKDFEENDQLLSELKNTAESMYAINCL